MYSKAIGITVCSLRWGRCGVRSPRDSSSGRTAGRKHCRKATSSFQHSRSSQHPATAPQTPGHDEHTTQRSSLTHPMLVLQIFSSIFYLSGIYTHDLIAHVSESWPDYCQTNTNSYLSHTLMPLSQLIHRSPRVRKQATAWRARWWIQPSCLNWRMMASIQGKPVLPPAHLASASGFLSQGICTQMGFPSMRSKLGLLVAAV